MTSKNKIITSFGSGFTKPGEPLYNEIEQIGKNNCSKRLEHFAGGGYQGTMEAISKGANPLAGKTIGHNCKRLDKKTEQIH